MIFFEGGEFTPPPLQNPYLPPAPGKAYLRCKQPTTLLFNQWGQVVSCVHHNLFKYLTCTVDLY